jgi:hypothetical protein
VNKQNRFIFMLITIKRQAELEGRHSQAGAWERDKMEIKIWALLIKDSE